MLSERKAHVLGYGHRIEQGSILEEHPDSLADLPKLALAQPAQEMARNANLSRVRLLQSSDHAQERRFTAPTSTQQHVNPSLSKTTLEPLVDGTVTEGEINVLDGDEIFLGWGSG